MIAFLRGKIFSLNTTSAVIDVGGVGYKTAIPLSTFTELQKHAKSGFKDDVSLYVFAYTQDGETSLYGFHAPIEKQVFEKLLRVGGIGPSLALSVLSTLGAEGTIVAISSQDESALSRVPKVGKKLAGRILLELKDKMEVLKSELTGAQIKAMSNLWRDVVSALVNMGYNAPEAESAVRKVREQFKKPARQSAGGEEPSFEDAFRLALKNLR